MAETNNHSNRNYLLSANGGKFGMNHSIVELHGNKAYILDKNTVENDSSPDENHTYTRDIVLTRTTEDLSQTIEPGDRISTEHSDNQKIVRVTPHRSMGLPVWSICFCDEDVDIIKNNIQPGISNELVMRDGDIVRLFNPIQIKEREITPEGTAEHQARLAAY